MLIRVSSCIIFMELFITSQCAPKLGPVLFDPLTLDTSDLVNELPPPVPIAPTVLRSESKPNEASEHPCQGYNYDGKNCTEVNDRILCGYDKNINNSVDENENVTVSVGTLKDCRLKGDRIECGYITGPFEGIWRPSPTNSSNNSSCKEAMRISPIKTIKNPIITKLKAASSNTVGTERNLPINKLKAILSSSDVNMTEISNENFNETNIAETILRIAKTEIGKLLNLTVLSTLIETNDTSHLKVTPTSKTNGTTTSTSHDSSTFLDILATREDTKTESSSITKEPFVNKIRIKRRNSWNNKPVTLCVEKQGHIQCYDDRIIFE